MFCLENNQINQVNTYYISRDKESLTAKYGRNTLNKFSNIINMEKGQIITKKIGNYTKLPSLNSSKNVYINPQKIKLD